MWFCKCFHYGKNTWLRTIHEHEPACVILTLFNIWFIYLWFIDRVPGRMDFNCKSCHHDDRRIWIWGHNVWGRRKHGWSTAWGFYDVSLFIHCRSSILSLFSNKRSLKKLHIQFSLILEFTLSIRDFIW